MKAVRQLQSKLQTKLNYSGPAFEVSVDSDTFGPRIVNHHGLPYPCTAMAFDSLLGLIAAGSFFGDIKIFGANGVEVMLHAPIAAPIHALYFLPQQQRLVSLDGKNNLQLWGLKEQGPIKKASFVENITCSCITSSGNTSFFGLDDGRVLVFDYVSFQLSKYVIKPPSQLQLQDTPVSCIECQPFNDNSVLITYDNGKLLIWDISKQSPAIVFENSKPIQCVAWHSSGEQFATGFEDGSLAIWDLTSPKPIASLTVTKDAGKRGPVRQLAWLRGGLPYGNANPASLLISGGVLEYEPHGVIILKGESFSEHILIPVGDDCDQFIVIYKDIHSDDPPAALLTFSRNQLLLNDVKFKGRFASSVFPSLAYPPATCVSDMFDMPSNVAKMLESIQSSSKMDDDRASAMIDLGLVDGGSISITPELSRQRVFATGHEEGVVQLWETGKDAFLRRMAIIRMDQLPIDETLEFATVTVVRLSSDVRGDTVLTMGFKSGFIAMLEVGSQRLNVRSCVKANGRAITIITLITTQYLVAGDAGGCLFLLDPRQGKVLAKLQLETTEAITCLELVDIGPMLTASKQRSGSVTNTTEPSQKMVAPTAKPTERLYCGLANGTIHVVSLQTFTNLVTFSAKKPSKLHALVAFDPEWNLRKESARSRSASVTATDGTSGTYTLMAVSENHVRIYSLPDNVYLSKLTPEGSLHLAFLKQMIEAVFLVGFVDVATSNQSKTTAALVVYALPSLNLVSRQPVPFSIKNLRSCFSPDEDTVIVLTEQGEIVHLGLLAQSTKASSGRSASISLVTDRTISNIAMAATKTAASSKMKQVAGSLKSMTSSMFKRGGGKEKVVDDHVNVEAIFKDKMPSSEMSAIVSVQDNAFTAAALVLQERGEKLQELSNKTAELADAAQSFYELSRNLRKSQQRRLF